MTITNNIDNSKNINITNNINASKNININKSIEINNQIVDARSDLDQKLAAQQRMQQAGTDPASASQVLSSPVMAGLRAHCSTGAC
jgi:uncharacterized protein involved in exopolysaccharide biosynthesis